MVAKLTVTKETGELLFDTTRICYGLVKSGYLTYISSWSRRTLRSAQLDKNDGASWTTSSEAVVSDGTWDPMYGFTLSNFKSPIVFLTGPGCLVGTVVSGASITFYYANAGASTKFYCFDFMANNIAGSPYLKTYDASGVLTFNSLQVPLNVVATLQAPPPSVDTGSGIRGWAYEGGTNQVLQQWLSTVNGRQRYPKAQCIYTYSLSAGVEYAAYLPWARSAGLTLGIDVAGNTTDGGVSEGAYGGVGGVTFQMGSTGGTTFDTQVVQINGFRWHNVPLVFPTALVIKTANLQFPFN